jgi:L-alanine-DL-glutamate epimerase-like enolase superfamily enzyme
MKIVDIRAIPLLGRIEESGWEAQLASEENTQTLIEVVTDEGLRGYGSSYTSLALVEGALRLLRPWFSGESAIEPERVSEKLHQTSFWQGRGGAVTHAISGIDMALWDLLGKVAGQPVARLLGGYYRDRIKPYGSVLFDEPDRLRDKLQRATERGFRAIKMGWGPFGRIDRKTDELLVRTAREAVGPDVELMVDAGGSEQFWPHSFKWALETARMLADYDVVWFEEALPPDDIAGYIKLREHAPLFISAGEVLTRRQSFVPWIERGAVDIIQPDCSKVGGLSEARRIGWMAYDHNVLLVPHGWNNAVGLAADLHLVAALPVARWVEYLTPSPFIEEITTTPFRLDGDGMLPIPTAPGLGIELDAQAIEKYSRK